MKRLIIISATLLMTISLSTNAQHKHQGAMDKSEKSSMMQSGMMGQGGMMGMMNGMQCPMCGKMMSNKKPMQKYLMVVNFLPNKSEELSLTNEQFNKLIDLQTSFKKQQIEYKADLRKKRMKLQSLLDENASSDEIREQMQECSNTKINMKLAAYETVIKMKNELTDDQKSKLTDLMNNQANMMTGSGMMQNTKNH